MIKDFKAWAEASRQIGKVITSREKVRAREGAKSEAREREAEVKAALKKATRVRAPSPKKQSTRELIEGARNSHLEASFETNAKKARAIALRRIARKLRVSLSTLQQAASLLAGFQVQELVSRGSVTLPR